MEILKRLIEACSLDSASCNGELESAIEEAKNFLDVLKKVPSPLFDRVVVKVIEPENNEGGMILPESDNQHYGVLISKGEDVSDKLKVDDIVFWTGEFGELLTVEGEEFILAPYRELKGVIK